MKSVISFNKKIYTAKAVRRALADFKELADFNTADSKGHYLVEIKNSRGYSPETIKDELGNYLLQLMRC